MPESDSGFFLEIRMSVSTLQCRLIHVLRFTRRWAPVLGRSRAARLAIRYGEFRGLPAVLIFLVLWLLQLL